MPALNPPGELWDVRVIELLSTLVIAFMSLGEIGEAAALNGIGLCVCVVFRPFGIEGGSNHVDNQFFLDYMTVGEFFFPDGWLYRIRCPVMVGGCRCSRREFQQQQHVQWSKVPGRDKYYDSCLHIKS